jgi:hypothetical protein
MDQMNLEIAVGVTRIVGGELKNSFPEFDDHLLPDDPLGRLVAIAFGPWTSEDEAADEDSEQWYEKIHRPFSDRYEFC